LLCQSNGGGIGINKIQGGMQKYFKTVIFSPFQRRLPFAHGKVCHVGSHTADVIMVSGLSCSEAIKAVIIWLRPSIQAMSPFCSNKMRDRSTPEPAWLFH
jgi:hypothetical protein